MEISTAREIVTQAKNYGIYEGELGDSDAAVLTQADEIVGLAEEAWAAHVRGPEVESILNLANAHPENSNGHTPEAVEEPEESVEESHTPEEDFAPTEYETVSPTEDMSRVEPWDGYADGTVQDVTGGINYFADDDDTPDDDFVNILIHVHAFESSHKKRARILKVVADSLNGKGYQIADGAEAEEEASGDEPEAAEAEAESSSDDELPGSSEGIEADAVDESVAEAVSESTEDRPGEHEAEPPAEDRQPGPGSLLRALQKRVNDELLNERSDIPKPPAEEIEDLPWRWADISNEKLHDFLMQYSALAYYKSFVYARDERIALHAKEAADEMHNKILVGLSKYDEKGKEKKVAVIEAEIESDDNVRKWRRIQRQYEKMALVAKREMESMYKLVESLSRLESMRHQAWERGRK